MSTRSAGPRPASAAVSRAVATTVSPRSSTWVTIARPRPREAPVTNQVRVIRPSSGIRLTRRFTRPCPTVVAAAVVAVPQSTWGGVVPLINVKVIEGVFSQGQKAEIVKGLTEAMVAVEGENMRPVTWVVVEEVRSGDWGIGGVALTTADVQALAAGGPAG